ncbi:hypothetical protein AB0F91_17480 [Amycolatopsis sp. NPDC023774]|uniref:hypothetical protein n=1 Tax=Amycolatopsis sp. NPDC023774 TaxID=3155015 RepID=UPI0033D4AE6B
MSAAGGVLVDASGKALVAVEERLTERCEVRRDPAAFVTPGQAPVALTTWAVVVLSATTFPSRRRNPARFTWRPAGGERVVRIRRRRPAIDHFRAADEKLPCQSPEGSCHHL